MSEQDSPSFARRFRRVVEMFHQRVEEMSEREAFRFPVNESWLSLTWKQTAERVSAIAAGIVSLGVQSEQRCGIMSNTRLEWILVDLGILCAGAATTTATPPWRGPACRPSGEPLPSHAETADHLQRLLATDQAEAAELVAAHAKGRALPQLYDEILIPALTYAHTDYRASRLTAGRYDSS